MTFNKRKLEPSKETLLNDLLALINNPVLESLFPSNNQLIPAINLYLSAKSSPQNLSNFIFHSLVSLLVNKFDSELAPKIEADRLLREKLSKLLGQASMRFAGNEIISESNKTPTNSPTLSQLTNLDKSNTKNINLPLTKKEPNMSFKDVFFSKIFQTIKNKTTYNEFLSIINLYNQQLLDGKDLVAYSESFLKDHHHLIDVIKLVVGYSYHNDDENYPGPSYKCLKRTPSPKDSPKNDIDSTAILNEKWLSHPTWASERSEFVYHKKNIHEEALFHIEEERHQLSIDIETNFSLIQQLLPVYQMLQNMSDTEKDNLTLPFRLGGDSIALPRRALKKVYDARRSIEILEALHTHPAIAVPVVIKRLEQKDKEWRKLRDELEPTWREAESKNFYRSLDHRSATIKSQDRRYYSSKFFINELVASSAESIELPNRFKSLNFEFSNSRIMNDILLIVQEYLDKNSFQNYPTLKTKADSFVFSLFNGLCGINTKSVFSSTVSKLKRKSSSCSIPEEYFLNRPKNTVSVVISSSKYEKSEGLSNNAPLYFPTYNSTSLTKNQSLLEISRELWPNFVPGSSAKSAKFFWKSLLYNSSTRLRKGVFCDSSIYNLVRMILLIYSRFLEIFKFCSDKYLFDGPKHYPSTGTESQTIKNMGLGYLDDYSVFLNLTKRYCLGKVASPMYEDLLRYLLGTKAFLALSLDKLISNVSKNLLSASNSSQSISFMNLFNNYRGKFPLTYTDFNGFLRQASKISVASGLSDNLFFISYSEFDKNIYFDKVEPKLYPFTGKKSSFDFWVDYLIRYLSPETHLDYLERKTRFHPSKCRQVYLKRNMRKTGMSKQQFISIIGSNIFSFAPNSYKLKFNPNTYQAIINHTQRASMGNKRLTPKNTANSKSKLKWNQFLDSRIRFANPT